MVLSVDVPRASGVEVYAFDRQGLLHDITRVLTDIKVNLTAAETRSDSKNLMATMRLTIEIPDFDVLSQVLSRVDLIPNVVEVRRVNQ
jgi:GTP pyrophosphokinase|tara:strand:+ start:7365 stop:7628 length:264 start_codon:yes stop_codon:yes gene_type:complete